MKNLILAITFLLCASTAWGRMNALVVSGGVGQSAGADYQVAKCYLYVTNSSATATETKMGVYNSSGTRIAETAVATIGSSGFPKLVEHVISTGPTLTPGNTYYISFSANGYLNTQTKTPSYSMYYNTRGTWSSIPSSINTTTDTEDSSGEVMMYCTNSSDQVLLNTSSTTGYTITDGSPNSNINTYYRYGYSCNTL